MSRKDMWEGQPQAVREERFRALIGDLCIAVLEGRETLDHEEAPSMAKMHSLWLRAMRKALKRTAGNEPASLPEGK